MNTGQIRINLEHLDCFLGVFARNRVPGIVNKRPSALIVNSDPDSLPGEH